MGYFNVTKREFYDATEIEQTICHKFWILQRSARHSNEFFVKIILFHLLDFKNYQKIVLYTIFSRRLSYIITLGVGSGPVCATDVERILLQMLLRHDVRTIIG